MGRRTLGHTKVNILLDPTVLHALKWLAASRGTSYSELIRAAAKEYAIREITQEQKDISTLASVSPSDAAA